MEEYAIKVDDVILTGEDAREYVVRWYEADAAGIYIAPFTEIEA